MDLPGIPRLSGGPIPISIEVGEQMFIVGANGSGKSALIQHFAMLEGKHKIRRITAHRQTWFESGNLDFTARRRKQFEENNMHWDRQTDSRWTDPHAAAKLSAVLFDLVAKDNARNRTIGQHIDDNNPDDATAFVSKSVSPFKQLNELLDLGRLTVSLTNSHNEEIVARHRDNCTSFSIAQMSDGERAAAIMAADVLTVEPGTILLINEPERHLHRSIIEPFLTALFSRRKDFAFVISTHEIALPSANPSARVLMVRSCTWNVDSAQAWDVEVLESKASLPEDLKLDILGSRQKILFVEGTANSLDLPLYRTLFPELSVIPKGSCGDVIRAVKGLRGSQEFHHVEAFGLIDRADRTEDKINELAKDKVFALDVCSAEALYYCSEAIEAVAHRQSKSLGRESDMMIEASKRAGLEALKARDLSKRMAARRCERQVRNQIEALAPSWNAIMKMESVEISVPVKAPYADELERFGELVEADNLNELITRYPLRESNVFGQITKALKCRNRADYERMVVARVREDVGLARKLKQQIGPLSEILDA